MLKAFQDFINKGNVIDLAVAFIMGAAFNPIVQSLVNGIVMPPIGLLFGRVDFGNLGIVLTNADQYDTVVAAVEAGEAVIQYGAFINTIISFLITAIAVFLLIRGYNNLKARRAKEEEAAPPAPPEPSAEEKLLTEIRDLLAKQG
jgi:large conductance mechanosensitive channel